MIVNGNLNLKNCAKLKSLGKLKEVNGSLICPDNLEDLGNLKRVSGTLYLGFCNKLKSLSKLKKVSGTLACPDNLEDLGDLEYVNGNLDLSFCKNLKSLGKLKEVKGKIYLKSSGITKEYIKENYLRLLDKCNWNY